MDYSKELEKYADAPAEEKVEIEKLASLQKDIAIGSSAEDFVRHPFFKAFENHMNEVIADTKGAIMKVESIEQLKAHQAGIAAVTELKQWINAKVIAKRVGIQAIEIYEKDTEDLNSKIQEAVDKSKS